jgi:hypothetical protein
MRINIVIILTYLFKFPDYANILSWNIQYYIEKVLIFCHVKAILRISAYFTKVSSLYSFLLIDLFF